MLLPLLLAVLAQTTAPAAEFREQPTWPQGKLALDDLERVVEEKGPIRCPKVELVHYAGDVVRYGSPVRVNAEFRDRLRLFEAVVRDAAVTVYGRSPRRIVHLGTFNCRRIRTWPTYLSEHGLGNAIDVAGFDFAPLPRGTKLPVDLRRGFRVRLDPDWRGKEGAGAVHARFLREVAARLVERPDIFRVMLGPAYPGHHNHFHLDCAPWRIVDI